MMLRYTTRGGVIKERSPYVPRPENSHQPRNPTESLQPVLLELQKYDPRYHGLLLQPDPRPISQEQLASEVKSSYAGLTMVKPKRIHVDREQAAALMDSSTGIRSRLLINCEPWSSLLATCVIC